MGHSEPSIGPFRDMGWNRHKIGEGAAVGIWPACGKWRKGGRRCSLVAKTFDAAHSRMPHLLAGKAAPHLTAGSVGKPGHALTEPPLNGPGSSSSAVFPSEPYT